MTHPLLDLSRASLNDIIFEGRNKAYGAYELRLIYPRHLKRAIAAMLVLCAVLVAAPAVRDYLTPPAAVVPMPRVAEPAVYQTQEVPEFETPKPPATPAVQVPPPVVATQQFVPPVVVPNEHPAPDAALSDMALLNQADNIGAQTTEGVAQPAPVVILETAAPAAPATDEVLTYAEVAPEFPGGPEALQRYIAQNTTYSALALRNGVEGRVYVRFVVDETGRVVNPVVIKGIGYGCDEAALKMLRAMPAFTPGRQNGRPVKVYFNLPIVFKVL